MRKTKESPTERTGRNTSSDDHHAAEAFAAQRPRTRTRLRRIAGGLVAACLLAMPLMATAVAPVSAHSAYKTVTKYRQQCEMRDYWQRMPTVPASYELRQHEHCIRVPYQATVSRTHIHISKSVCRTVVGTPLITASTTAGGIIGTGSGGPGVGTVVGAAAGASVGTAATYTVCELVPDIVWLG